MAYKISVPLVRCSERREDLLRELERLGASRVFLCSGRGLDPPEILRAQLDSLADGLEYFGSHGYETGVWISTLGHGGGLADPPGLTDASRFTLIRSVTGVEARACFCPLDEGFSGAVCSWAASLARAGAKMIMLDDDCRLSNRTGGFGCLCDLHLEEFRRRVGEDIERGEVFGKVWCAGANKYRDAWLDLMGDTLRGFARALRAAVDSVNEDARLGACSCMSVWDGDGVDSIELAKIFAGKTAPFMRLIGAPYWAKTGALSCFSKRLGYVIELERMQAFWCRESGIETMAEGDVFPRPRYVIPAAYLEGFDTALRASGDVDGILKYAVDYISSPLYETGYRRLSEKNRPLCSELERRFSGKAAVGVNVAAAMKKLRGKEFPAETRKPDFYSDYSFFQPEQALLCDCGVPMTYGGAPVTICFGENAKYLSPQELGGALILDVPAAQILERGGIDTGLARVSPLEAAPVAEYFPQYDERVSAAGGEGLFEVSPADGAQVLSELDIGRRVPSVYLYENGAGQLLAVICADMSLARKNENLRRSYCRSRQLAELIRRMCPDFPALCPGHPDVYMIAKRAEGSLCVGLWNFFEDPVFEPEITLGGDFVYAEFINCRGSLDGRKIKLEGEIAPYSFAGFEVFERQPNQKNTVGNKNTVGTCKKRADRV